ncbi:MAG: glycosyltransferase family 39 protein [Chloroflexi bacterium]|nr:glycosyltransferase family 39 protein [Chloroflexota bacterium]
MKLAKSLTMLGFINSLLLGLAIRGMYHIYAVLAFPYDIANGEGFVLRDAALLFQGESIYQPVDRSPFLVSNYPPLFPWIASKLMLITGPSFIATRLVSALAFIGIAVLIVWYLQRKHMPIGYSLFAGLIFFNSIYVYYWSAWSRVDGLAVFFSLAAVIAIDLNQNSRSALFAAIACVAAVATKQSALSAPAAIAIYLLIRDRKLLLIFLGAWGGLLIPAVLWLNYATQGEFLQHIITYNQLEWYPRVFLGQLKNFMTTHFLFLLAYVYFVVHYFKRERLLMLYATLALITTVTTGRDGASTNYFIESIAITAMMIAFMLNDQLEKPTIPRLRDAAIGLLLIQIFCFAFPTLKPVALFNKNTFEFGLNPTQADLQACNQLNRYIQRAAGPILVENPGFAVINNKEVIGNAAVLKFFRRKGWNEPVDTFIQTIDAQAYDLIIFQGEAYDLDVLQATDRSYHQVARIDCLGEYEIKARNQ